VLADQSGGDGESNARAAGGGEERLEDGGLVDHRNADAVIGHPELYQSMRPVMVGADGDAASAEGVAVGVGQENAQDADHGRWIRENGWGVCVNVSAQLEGAFPLIGHARQRLLDEVRGMTRDEIEAAGATQLEQVVRQAVQARGLTVEDAASHPRGGVARKLSGEQVGCGAQGQDRVANLVSYAGHRCRQAHAEHLSAGLCPVAHAASWRNQDAIGVLGAPSVVGSPALAKACVASSGDACVR